MDLGDYNKYFEWLKENGFDSEHTIPKEHFDQINNIFFNINSKKIKNIDAYKKAIGEVNSLQKMINRLPPQKAGTQRYVSDNARKLRIKAKSSARILLEKQCTELEIKVLELKQKIQESVIPVRDRLVFFINNRYDYLDSDLTNLESIYSNYLHKASEFQKELRNVNCKIVEISKLTPKPGKALLDKVKKINKSINSLNSLYQLIPIRPFTKKFKIATKDLERHILNKGRIVAYKKSVDSFLSKTPDISKIENLIEK